MKRTICIILCLVLCIGLLPACGQKAPAPAPSASANVGDTNSGGNTTAGNKATPPPKDAKFYDDLVLYINDKVALIDPFAPGASNSQAGIYDHLIYDTLVYYNIDNEYEPCLATEWSTTDNINYKFKLRKDVKFQNGEPFTADDVAFTIDKAKEAPGTHIYERLGQVDSYKVINDYEIDMTLKKTNVDFIFDVSYPVAVITNRDAYTKDAKTAPWIGTGPFSIAKFVPNDSIQLAANTNYWGEKPRCKNFTLRYIAEETARMIMLENDEFTFCNVNSVYIPKFESNPKFVMNSYVMDNCNYIAFNMKKPITGDKNFRLAVAYAIDKQAIVDIALGGYGKAATNGTFWGNNTAYKNNDLPEIKQDLAKAKEYLAKSSYKGEKIELSAGLAHAISSAEVIMAQLRAIGINAEVRKLDSPSLTAATIYDKNDCDIVVGSGAWTALGSSIKSFATPGNNSNKACYENQEVVDLIAKAAATPDGDERKAMYYKIQELMYEDMPYVGTFYMALYIGAQKGTGGATYFPSNYHDYALAYRIQDAK